MKKFLFVTALFCGVAPLAMLSTPVNAAQKSEAMSMVETIKTYKEIKDRFPELSGFLSFFTYLTTDRLVRAYDMNPQLFVDYDAAVKKTLHLLHEGTKIPMLNIPAKISNNAAIAASMANLAALHAQVTALFAVAF